jgi:pyruvate-ferredoxin/flavodoxin oxidoreductase
MATESPLAAAQLLLAAEEAVCEAVFVAGLELAAKGKVKASASGADALRSALDTSGRAAVILGATELLGALGVLAEAANARAPIVVHVLPARAAGGVSPGRDELAPTLDVGAGVLISSSASEAVDLALVARRAAEDSETPFVHVYDGPAAVGEARVLDAAVVTKLLGSRDAGRSRADAGADGVARRASRKRTERGFAARVPFALGSAMRELAELTGRALSAIERYESADAEEVLVAVGAAVGPSRAVAQALRGEGRKVGMVGLRVLRPFFAPEVVKAVARARAIIVLEPLDVALAPSGPAATALKAGFADAITWAPGFPGVGRIPPIVSAVFATTADGAIAAADVRKALEEISAGDRARRVIVFGADAVES